MRNQRVVYLHDMEMSGLADELESLIGNYVPGCDGEIIDSIVTIAVVSARAYPSNHTFELLAVVNTITAQD